MHRVKSINYNGRLVSFERPAVMGILNVTPDSFYKDSRKFSPEEAERGVAKMLEEGADIIDIGGYSTRPGAADVTADEEYSRVARGLEAVRKIGGGDVMVSVDTFRADVARKVIEEWNVGIINDIGGGTLDCGIKDVVADLRVAYVLMHTRGTPSTMSEMTNYDDVVADVLRDLLFKADELHSRGVADVILDPGFGFAKTLNQNYELLDSLEHFSSTACPVLVGMSHKSMIWRELGTSAAESKNGTVVLDTIALLKGADIIRVHDVREAVETVALIEKIKRCRKDAELRN